jgi:RimJ/RimL family protein N-acetyltransferase
MNLDGGYICLEPLDPARHGGGLFEAGGGQDRDLLWRYLTDRPFPDRSSFEPWLTEAAASEDPLFFAAVDRNTGRAEGRLALMRIDPANGVAEVGHILFGPRLARSRGATEAIFLLARWVFDVLGYRRVEWDILNRHQQTNHAAIRIGEYY